MVTGASVPEGRVNLRDKERAAWVRLCTGSVLLTIQQAHERHGGTTPPALREEAERMMREGAEELVRLARRERSAARAREGGTC